MIRFALYLLVLSAPFLACKSASPVEQLPMVEEAVVQDIEENTGKIEKIEGDTDSLDISQELYDATLAEVRLFVDGLNTMIRNKDYESWKNTLSSDFLAKISSKEFLAATSESAILRSKKIVLKTPNDYFINVVVPSRSNSRVDEIEFTAEDKVKVFYLERRENNSTDARRLRLYELVKFEDTWKIID